MQTHHNTHIHINTLIALGQPCRIRGHQRPLRQSSGRLRIPTKPPPDFSSSPERSSIYIVLYTPLIPLGLINLWLDTNKNLSSLKVVAKVLLPLRTHKLYIAPPNSKEPGEPPRRPTTTTTTTMRDRS